MKKYIYLILSSISIAFWYACTPPLEGVTLKLPESVASSNVIVQFKPDNQAAGELPKNITITIAGKDSAKVVNIVGEKDFKVKQNVLSLAAQPGTTPSATNPINFTVVAEVDGYLKSVTPVSITSTKDLNLTIELTKISTPSKGITVVQQPATVSSGGTTSAAISVVTPANNGITEKATVSIPTGVTMKDASGVPVGGSLNIVVSKAEAKKTDVSVNSSAISKIVDKNNQVISDFTIVPIVGVEIEITNDDNQKVKNFSGTIEVKTEIPAGSIDALTRKELKAGDLMAITSFDEDTKVYKYEGPATLSLNTAGKLEVSGKVNHLTQFFFASFGSITIEVPKNSTPAQIEAKVAEAEAIFGANIESSQAKVFTDYTIALGGELSQYSDEVIQFIITLGNNDELFFYKSDRSDFKFNSTESISKIEAKNILGISIKSVTPAFVDAKYSFILPSAPNFINFIANLSCPAGKTTNADNIQVYSKAPGADDGQYQYLGKARRDGTLIKGTTTLLTRSGTYDFKFVVGSINFYYPSKKVSGDANFTITSTMPDVLCQ
jgi:hypothetical protein